MIDEMVAEHEVVVSDVAMMKTRATTD